GGTAEIVKLTRQEKHTAVSAAKAMGLTVAGVDMLPSARGPLILEVNSSPGVEGIETATAKDIASEIVKYLEGQYAITQAAKAVRHDANLNKQSMQYRAQA